MARYPIFISLLLVLLCLWINIWRYPSVWLMLQGQYVPQIQMDGSGDSNGQKDPSDPPSKKRPQDPENGLLVSKNLKEEFQDVSYGDSNDAGFGIRSRAPAPVVPVIPKNSDKKEGSDQQTKASSSKKNEKSNADPRKEPFRNATWSKPVSTESKEPAQNEDPDHDEKSSDTNEDDENRFVSWETDPSLKDENKIRNAFYVQTEETIGKVSFPVYVYRAPGEPGTSPMNIDQPSYGADTSSENASTVLPVRFNPIN